MSKRIFITAAAIAAIALGAGLWEHATSPNLHGRKANATHGARRPHPTLEQARHNTQKRLDALEKMTPDQWAEEQKRDPRVAKTLELAIANNKKRLDELNAMTPTQWEAKHQPHPKRQPASTLPHSTPPADTKPADAPPTTP